MNSKFKPIYWTFGLLFFSFVFMSYNGNPPPFRTQASPSGSSTCASGSCHSNGGSFTGDISFSGLPEEISPNTTYTISVTVNNPDGLAAKAGFQLITIDGSEATVGMMSNPSDGAGIETNGSRTFFEHRGGKTFDASNEANWSVEWTAPSTISGSEVQLWASGNIANGNGNSAGDKIVFNMQSYDFQGVESVSATITDSTHVSCNAGNDGSATVTVTEGTAPYTYNWSNNAGTTATVTGLTAGTYTVTVTDAAMETSTASVTITEPATALELDITSLLNIDCNTRKGRISVSASNGTPGYSYLWSNGSTSNAVSNLDAGIYTVTVTDANNCTVSLMATITENIQDPVANGGPNQFINCNTPEVVLNGSASSTGNNITYRWEAASGGRIVSDTMTLFPTVDAAGIYVLTVFNNSNGCQAQTQVEVFANFDEPTAIIATPEFLNCNSTLTLDASASSSDGGVSFLWSSPDGGIIASGEDTAMPVVSSIGIFEAIVIDNASGCRDTAQVVVQSENAPTVVLNGDTVINCFQPELILNAIGSSEGPDISYTWSTTDGHFVGGTMSDSTVIDSAGTYMLTVLNNSNNCSNSAVITISRDTTFTIANAGPDLNLICSNTFIELDAVADTSGQNVSYWWMTSNGNILAGANTLTPSVNEVGDYEFIVTNNISGCSTSDFATVGDIVPVFVDAGPNQALGCSGPTVTLDGTNSDMGDSYIYTWSTNEGHFVSGENTLNPVVDSSGAYFLAILNMANGCSGTDTVEVMTSTGFDANISTQTNVSCFGLMDGSATVTSTNGIAPFSYEWSNGDTTVTSNNLGDGMHQVTITDDTGCSNILNLDITQPDTLVAHASSTDETMAGAEDGRLMIIPSGGTTPYTILWSNGATTAFVSDVPSGTYTVTLTDGNDCQSIETVTVNPGDCSLALVSTQQNDVSCHISSDGEATILVNGGIMPYTYAWSSGGTEMTEMGLNAGTYSVTVTDNGGCSIEEEVTIEAPDELVLTLENSSDVTCADGLDGMATVMATGGTEPYQYRWLTTGDQDTMENNLAAGTHTVSVMDANGCDTTIDVIIGEPDSLEYEVESTNESLPDEADGTATISVSGGTSPYTYLWNDENAQTTPTAIGLSGGIYEVSITDANNCMITANIEVLTTSADLLVSVANVTNVSCYGEATGAASISVTGGVAPYEYEWSNGNMTDTATDLIAGTYTVVVTDAAENTMMLTVNILEPEAEISTMVSITHETALNANDGSATIDIMGGTAPYTDANDGQILMENLAPGEYNITITDANACTSMLSFAINSFICGSINAMVTTTDASCPDAADGSATIVVTDGTAPFTYAWSSGGTDATEEGLIAGDYTVTATDASNCETVSMISISAIDDIMPSLVAQNISFNLSDFDGLINLSPEQVDNGSADNCSMIEFGLSINEFDCSHIGENEVVLSGTDSSGNMAETTFMVTIIDDISPVLSCPNNIVMEGACNTVIEYDMPQAIDNCDNELNINLLSGLVSGSSFPAGTTTQIFETTDFSGNPSTCFFDVTVVGDVLEPNVVITEPSCTEFNDGSIAINVNGGTPPYTIDWMGIDPTQVGAGSYAIAITDANACFTNLNIVVSEPSPIQISEPSITHATNGQDNGEINTVISGGSGIYLYEWTMNGVVVSTDLNLVNVGAGVYVLQVKDSNDCTVASDELTIDNVVSVEELEQIERLDVLPNPNTGQFVLSMDLYKMQTVEVSLFDFTGKKVLRLAPERFLNKDVQLDMTHAARGVYWLKVLVEGEMVVRKVVLQ